MEFRKTSVIVCTQNRGNLLPGLIKQLRDQNYPKDAFEIIVVDNASTDNTRSVVEKLANKPGVSVRYVLENRPGITFARNRGAEEAQFPHLAYVDDDCSMGPEWLPQLVGGFEIDDRVMAVAGRVIMDFENQVIPDWLGPMSYRWLAEYDYPCYQPCLMENPLYITEGNMATTKQVLKETGGFLGMDQFGNPHVSANESMYLLEQIKRKSGKIAFVPEAIEYHHKIIPEKKQMLQRAYWNGVSAGILEYLLHQPRGFSVVYRVLINFAAAFTLFISSIFYRLKFNKQKVMFYLLKSLRRLGLAFCELHLVGDWHRIHLWNPARSNESMIEAENNPGL